MGIGDRIYGGMASFGVFMAFLGAIIGTLIGIGLIYFGASVYNQQYTELKAKVLSIDCDSKQCSNKIKYMKDNKEEIRFVYTSKNRTVSVGNEVSVFVGDDNSVSLDNPKTGGIVLICIGLFVILAGWVWYWITKKYEFAAATSGLSNSLSMVRSVFN